jgi:hypothetical protein
VLSNPHKKALFNVRFHARKHEAGGSRLTYARRRSLSSDTCLGVIFVMEALRRRGKRRGGGAEAEDSWPGHRMESCGENFSVVWRA